MNCHTKNETHIMKAQKLKYKNKIVARRILNHKAWIYCEVRSYIVSNVRATVEKHA